ncbi:MAG: cation:proton antiporter [Hydrogenophaga sp.]|uniref:cation:proton antiporter n=1 Tax=Hydrogenophaga sp. TaxID=1904254 RepID=UPI002ABAC0F3|nr:cation:proton antiporter [Hydrogenophaga sp.]MDZ4104085.1 cation:proton antiporter [Hydrogenophaga sp.]
MQILTSLLTLIVLARVLGHLFTRWGQPAIVGEMLAGILLGPAILGLVEPNPALSGIASLAIFLVVLDAGLEMSFQDVQAAMRGRGLIVAMLAFFLPFCAGAAVAWAFDQDLMRIIFLGLCIAITAMPVAVKMLDEMGLLQTDIGRYSVSTAVINDILALFILGVLLALPAQTSWSAILATGGVVTLKLLVLALAVLGFNALLNLLDRRGVDVSAGPERLAALFGPEAVFGIVIVFVLAFGSLSESLGFHFVIGAFFGALLLDKRQFLPARYADLRRTLSSITGGFLAPVFFAYLGLEFQISALADVAFVAAVLTAAIASKVLAGWIGGRAIGMSNREALGLGFILNGRGAMELVVASIALERGFIGQGMFSVLVLMGVVTTLLAPISFNAAVDGKMRDRYRETGQM